jgi:hypothetical protein
MKRSFPLDVNHPTDLLSIFFLRLFFFRIKAARKMSKSSLSFSFFLLQRQSLRGGGEKPKKSQTRFELFLALIFQARVNGGAKEKCLKAKN